MVSSGSVSIKYSQRSYFFFKHCCEIGIRICSQLLRAAIHSLLIFALGALDYFLIIFKAKKNLVNLNFKHEEYSLFYLKENSNSHKPQNHSHRYEMSRFYHPTIQNPRRSNSLFAFKLNVTIHSKSSEEDVNNILTQAASRAQTSVSTQTFSTSSLPSGLHHKKTQCAFQPPSNVIWAPSVHMMSELSSWRRAHFKQKGAVFPSSGCSIVVPLWPSSHT